MNSNDLEKVFAKVIDEKITPKFKRLGEKMDATMEMTAKNSEEITLLRDDLSDFRKENKKEHENMRKDINALKEDVDDLKDTTTRTELKLNSVVKRQDDQGDQVIEITKALNLKPKAN